MTFYGARENKPMTAEEIKAAKRVCAACPVVLRCLQYALERDERWGIWGGKTYSERERIRALL